MIGLMLLVALVGALTGGLGGESAARLVSEADASYAAAPVVHQADSYTRDGHRYQVDLTETKAGEGEGTVVLDGQQIEFRYTGGRAFIRAGQSYLAGHISATLAPFLAGRWVTNPTITANFAHLSWSPARAQVGLARSGFTTLRKGRSLRIDGRPAVELSDATGEVYVSTGSPQRYLRLVSRPGYRTADGSSDISIELDYPAGLTVQAPTGVIDTTVPQMLPAQYSAEPGSFKFGSCNTPSGCTMTVTVRNQRGIQIGTARADFHLMRPDGTEIGTCSAPINPVAYDQTEDLSCTVSGLAWTSFIRAGGQYQGRVTIHNSFYDA